MPVTGIKQVRSNMKSIFKDISDKKAPKFVQAVLSIGYTASRELTPVEYSTLANSVIMNVNVNMSGVDGELFYMANYAAALEFGNWKPVAAANKEGPADNMQAEPHFLRKGFESSESQAAIKRAKSIFKV